jgi:hypothetical protein
MTLELKNERDYAALRECSIRTVQRERSKRIGPPYIKLGKKIFYRVAAIEEWLLAQEQAQPRARTNA